MYRLDLIAAGRANEVMKCSETWTGIAGIQRIEQTFKPSRYHLASLRCTQVVLTVRCGAALNASFSVAADAVLRLDAIAVFS